MMSAKRETSCLHGMKAPDLMCCADITTHLQSVLPLALDLLAYDPGLLIEEEEESGDMDVEEEEEEFNLWIFASC